MLFKNTVFIGVDPPSGENSITYAALDKELNLIALSRGDISEVSAFAGGQKPPCLAACDVNGNGVPGSTDAPADAIYQLEYAFLGGLPPPPPFPDCGVGTESDVALGCETPPAACR